MKFWVKAKKWLTTWRAPAYKQAHSIVKPEDNEPAAHRRQLIERHRARVEAECSERVSKEKPDYDWDVCMISYFHDG